jgi:DNA-binding transcriptional ArsR family regulator
MLLVAPAYPAELAEVLDVSRAKTSNHLACLRGCGLVTATREGRIVAVVAGLAAGSVSWSASAWTPASRSPRP